MPARFESAIAVVIYLIGSFFSGLAAIFETGLLASVVIGNSVMTFTCIVGACGGALLSLIFFPPKDTSARMLAIKFLGSGVTSVIFSPYIIRWMSDAPEPEFVLFVSGAVGLSAVYVIRGITRAVRKKSNRFAGEDADRADES